MTAYVLIHFGDGPVASLRQETSNHLHRSPCRRLSGDVKWWKKLTSHHALFRPTFHHILMGPLKLLQRHIEYRRALSNRGTPQKQLYDVPRQLGMLSLYPSSQTERAETEVKREFIFLIRRGMVLLDCQGINIRMDPTTPFPSCFTYSRFTKTKDALLDYTSSKNKVIYSFSSSFIF